MTGLPQAGMLAQDRLFSHLAIYGYLQDTYVPCRFTHVSDGVTFTLVVNDFGVKYFEREAADHLITCLHIMYKIKVDWADSRYLGITLVFDYVARTATLRMPAP